MTAMFLSRFWYLILAVLAAAAAGAAALVSSVYRDDRAGDAEMLVRADRSQVDMLLRLDARVRLDNLGPVAADAELGRLLVAAKDRRDDGPGLAEHAQHIATRLRALNVAMGAEAQGHMLIAVDDRGVVVGRVGTGENAGVGDPLGGHPLVQKALEGFLRDDVWELQGLVYRMAARPVIQQGRYVGAVVHARAIDGAFTVRISDALGGPTVAFFKAAPGVSGTGITRSLFESHDGEAVRGVAGVPAGRIGDAFRTLDGSADWRARGRTEPVALGSELGTVAFGALAGQVGAAGGGFAVARPSPRLPADFLLHPPAEAVARLPWPLIGGCALLCMLLGWLFVYLEHDRHVGRLRAMIEELGARKIDHVDPRAVGGSARGIAIALNDAVDHLVAAARESAAGRPRASVDASALRSAAESAGPSFAQLPLASAPKNVARPQPPPPKPATPPPAPASAIAAAPPPAPAPAPPPVPQSVSSAATLPSRPPPPPPHAAASPMPAPMAPPPAPPRSTSGLLPLGVQDSPVPGSLPMPPPPPTFGSSVGRPPPPPRPSATTSVQAGAILRPSTRPSTPPPPPAAAHRPTPAGDLRSTASVVPSLASTMPASASTPPAAGAGLFRDEAEEQAHWHEVFEAFVALRQSHGEPTDSLVFERFSGQRARSKADMIQRTGCAGVRFVVYARDGKAALKATAVR